MKILFDTNVIIDIWGRTQNFMPSFVSYDLSIFGKCEPCITTTMMTDFAYLLTAHKYMSKEKAHETFGSLLELFEVLDVNASDCIQAHQSKMDDLEDAMIAYAAKRHGVDFIVTRNKRDFVNSPVPALTPQEFIDIYKPTWLHYQEIELD